MRSVRAIAVFLGLAASGLFAEQPVPRPSPEFVINYPGGRQALLSSYKGKVVLLTFIFTTCPHCQSECQMLSKLYSELGPKGFQPLAVAVNPMSLMLVPDFVRDYHTNFPIGASEQPPALNYLGINMVERWVVPQIVLIDRKGVVRAQSVPLGTEKLQEEGYIRQQIEALLHEGSSVTKRTAPVRKRPT
jgi:peroxiredoxin